MMDNFLTKKVKVKLKDLKKRDKKIVWRKKHVGLREDVLKKYDENNCILISKDMKIMDGHHRYQILIDEYGEEYELYVNKVKMTFNQSLIFLILTLPLAIGMTAIFSPILLFKFLLRKLISQVKELYLLS
jgi:hypothetical protein